MSVIDFFSLFRINFRPIFARLLKIFLTHKNKSVSLKINKMNHIGLDKTKSNELAKILNDLLSNYQVFYMNIRGFHWNIKGEKFFELHLKFEELYNDLLLKIDEIAERILTPGATPVHSFSDYILNSKIKETKQISDGFECVKSVLDSFKTLLN